MEIRHTDCAAFNVSLDLDGPVPDGFIDSHIVVKFPDYDKAFRILPHTKACLAFFAADDEAALRKVVTKYAFEVFVATLRAAESEALAKKVKDG